MPRVLCLHNYHGAMAQLVNLDDLLDAAAVAAMLGLSSATAVSTYRARYDDFPAPAWVATSGRCQAWLRQDLEAWARSRGRT